MKIFHKLLTFFIFLLLLSATSCKKYLKENNVSNITSSTYYTTSAGFESLVTSCYPLLRNITETRSLVMGGTDIFSLGGSYDSGIPGNPLDVYDATLNSQNGAVSDFWNLLYIEIGRCNTVVSRAPGVADIDNQELQLRVAEAKFLRAYCYFMAVQQWGDIPMPLTETTSASTAVVQTSAPDVYNQIIKDLKDAVAVLPAKASDYGRATLGAAQFLLARVYLTRGWNYTNTAGEAIGGSSADFDTSLTYADDVIGEYPLATNYTDLFPIQYPNQNPYPLSQSVSQVPLNNPEIIFSVQYGSNPLYAADDPAYKPDPEAGNDAHSVFIGQAEAIPGNVGRTGDYNRYGGQNRGNYAVTPAMYRLFDPNLDTRYKYNFVGAEYALKAVPNFHPISGNNSVSININAGDTVISFRPWDNPATLSEKGMDVGGTKPYAVYNVDEFNLYNIPATPYNLPNINPLMWKFFEPHIQYGDAYGTLAQPLFRVSEAYLIAAEAIVKGATGGKLGGADVYYNKIVNRALGPNAGSTPYRANTPGDLTSMDSVSYVATPGNVSIDMILNERARELMGENMRWYDLKRTGTLISRTMTMNPWTKLAGTIDAHDLLRPIPQSEIDLSSTPIKQNPGY